ncbi:centrosomal protein of 126 kDa [Scomber japonicus]|uniref:centrosomal protein of 126 kDa n=1 Tax=Scomber japonicus TaxID=13676 RepID=UPI002304FB67|nr:centrosomal protein of 126 kDa [Scomber japonicus]
MDGLYTDRLSCFTYRNSKLGADEDLKDDRQLLVEEQKLCRARARRFSSETKRRRKLLEDRRKQWDVQEQRLRENILQQRRELVLDATERFQRAHLPPSQRRRQSFRRQAPNIEDALNEIQGTLSSCSRQSSFLSSYSNITSCTPSPRPPTVSKSSHRQALSALEAYTKLLQEQSACVKNSQETQKTQERQRDHSPQDNHLSYCCNSDSLLSKDSLENEEPNHSTKNHLCSYSSFLLDSEKPHLDMRKQNDLCPSSDLTSLSAMMHLGINLDVSRKLQEPKQRKQEETEGLNNKIHVSKAPWGFTTIEQTPKTETQPPLHNCSLLTLEIISGEPEHCEVNVPQNSHGDNIMVTSNVVPGNTALESSYLKQVGHLLDLRQQRVQDDRQLKHPSPSEIILPAKNGNSKDILFGAPPTPSIFLIDSTADNASQERFPQQTKEHNYLSSQKESGASINNLNKVSNSETKAEKPFNAASLQHVCLSNIQSDTSKCLKYPKEEVQKLPVSMGSSHSVCEVRFIKGILKKQSKYMSGDTAYLYGSGHLFFAKQVALAIRDSVELTRAKKKEEEGNNTVKKKLRWFDEVHVEKDKEQTTIKQMRGKSSNLSPTKNDPQDHQLSLTTVSGASKPGPSMTLSASTGYHFTKQAWADVGVQVSLPQERVDEVKVPRCSTRTSGPKVPRRERSARVGAGPVSSKTRKGIVIRPQSATEVSQIAKTQGKIMVPRPPPRMEAMEEKAAYSAKTPYGTDHTSVNCKQALAAEQALHKDNSEGFFSPYTHHVIRTDSSVMYTPLPPSYTNLDSEGNTKGMPGSGHKETLSCVRRSGMVYDEKGLCLDCTPTDEEISQLWQGVCSALVTKDAKNMVRRQTPESGRVWRKPYVEQSRQPSGSKNRRPPPQPSQPPKQAINSPRPHTKTDMGFTDEGLESASQFHLAEVHARGLLEERDIVVATETAQTQRPRTVQQRQQQGLTTISLEEQKILLSLDRLNYQLQSVREHGGNTGMRGLVLIDAPSTKETKATNNHKHCASSANNRTRYQKKC